MFRNSKLHIQYFAVLTVFLIRVDVPPPTLTLDDPNLKFPLTREEPGTPGEREITWTFWERPGEFTGIGYLGSMIEIPPQPAKIYKGTKLIIGDVEGGLASWYRYGGGLTPHLSAKGAGLTTASTKYPKGTYLRVTNLANNRSVIVKVNDFGPEESTGRIVDLERKAFQKLAPLSIGVIRVRVEEIL